MTKPPRYSWNQPMCFNCYQIRYPGRFPVRLKQETDLTWLIESCVDCNRLTIEGIWMRVDPKEAKYPTNLKEED